MPKIVINPDEEFTHLPSAPIVEAVIDIRSQNKIPMTETIVRENAGNKLSGYSYVNTTHEFMHEVKMQGVNPPEQKTKMMGWKGVHFHNSDKKNIVQFNRDGFVYSRLTPYESWGAFLTEGLRLWEVYCEIAQPLEIGRVGLRFVNRIEMPQGEVAIENYINSPPTPPRGLELPFHGFMHQETLAVPDYPYAINFIRTIQRSDESNVGKIWVILDIDVFTTQSFEFTFGHVIHSLNEMRWLKNKVFFGSITEKTLEVCQ